jgi:hypothetical protein
MNAYLVKRLLIYYFGADVNFKDESRSYTKGVCAMAPGFG